MCHTSGYPFDLNCCITLPMSLLTLVVFTSLEFEDDDFKMDDEFKDFFNDKEYDDDEEDDY